MALEEWVIRLTELVVPLINLAALLLITGGTIEAFIGSIVLLFRRRGDEPMRSALWMRYSRWLIAGLTFQLAADIIETSAAPNWDDIGKLAAIAAIRTFLNFFLERDVAEMRRERERRAEKANTSGP